MKKTVVKWKEKNDYVAQMSCGEYKITSNKSNQEAFKPPELILASLGTCGGLFLKPALAKRGVSWESLQISVSGTKASPPNLFESITLDYEIEAEISEEELLEALEESHQNCLVLNTLNPNIEVKTTFSIK